MIPPEERLSQSILALDDAIHYCGVVDRKGNVYSTVRDSEIWITSPEGTRLGVLQMPQIATEPRPRIVATNLTFGDADSKTLYITACTHLFRIRLKVPGVRPGPQN